MGGLARAQKLSPEQRRQIAQLAAAARWAGHEGPPIQATHVGTLVIGEAELDCAVLEDGRRVLSQRGVNRALGRKHGGGDFKAARAASDGGGELPIFLAPKGLEPFISEELRLVVNKPVPYLNPAGGGIAKGIEASALPLICEAWLRARDAGILRKAQRHIAMAADTIMRGLARVGIIALVDEATGYQYERARTALADILESFIRKELAAWAKRFPDDYYKQLFRLKKLEYEEISSKRPPMIGKITKDIVYKRLAPMVLDELERLNPKDDDGRRKAHHHRWLTDDVGHPKLREHLTKLIVLTEAADDWQEFIRKLDKGHPKYDLPLLALIARKTEQASSIPPLGAKPLSHP